MSRTETARAVLAAHDALKAANAREPATDESGIPYDPSAWLRWNDNMRKPAYENWTAAMDALDMALGEHVSRHPINFRPLCEELIAA